VNQAGITILIISLVVSWVHASRAEEVFLPQITSVPAKAPLVNPSSATLAVPVAALTPPAPSSQDKASNAAELSQVGVNNLATLAQLAGSNLTVLSQQGRGNVATVTQSARAH
jgi:hypothetical protein